ncbi:hypothetical protein EPN29_05395 [bacterium]|nr:MAG: hypothetical protein EPN29_05395 [bacterium]
MITSIAKMRYIRIAGFAAGAVAVSGAAVLITASAAGLQLGFHSSGSQPNPADTAAFAQKTGKASAVCGDFVSHLSNDLGISQSKLNAAIQKAAGETLADEVKNGDLTQAQADAIKQKLTGQAPCSLAGGLGRKPGARSGAGAYLQQLLSAAASALGISEAQLKADLAQGMTLSQVAAAQNPPVTEAQFRSRLIGKLTPLLDAAVKSKRLTGTQEQAILKQLQTGPIPFWNTPAPRAKSWVPAASTT